MKIYAIVWFLFTYLLYAVLLRLTEFPPLNTKCHLSGLPTLLELALAPPACSAARYFPWYEVRLTSHDVALLAQPNDAAVVVTKWKIHYFNQMFKVLLLIGFGLIFYMGLVGRRGGIKMVSVTCMNIWNWHNYAPVNLFFPHPPPG